MSNKEKAEKLLSDFKSGLREFSLKTSGSTGEPKTILLKRDLMEKSARSSIQALGLTKQDKFLISISLDSVGGFMQLYRAFLLGADFQVNEPAALPFQNIASTRDFTCTSMVPYQLKSIFTDETESKKLFGFRKILLGGAPIDRELETKIKSFSQPLIYHTYGMTETYSHIALRKINEGELHFRTVPGISVSTTNKNQLIILGFTPEPIITNDLCTIYDESTFDISGRSDEIINSGGVKIQLRRVEEYVRQSKCFRTLEFFAAGIPDEIFGQKLVLVVEGEFDPETSSRLLNSFKNIQEKYSRPKKIFYVKKFDRTSSLKIDKINTLKKIVF